MFFPNFTKRVIPFFSKTTGFGALMRVLPSVFSRCLKLKKGFTVADVTGLFNEIRHFNFDNWKKIGAGNSAEIQAAEALRSGLEDAFDSTTGDGSSIRNLKL